MFNKKEYNKIWYNTHKEKQKEYRKNHKEKQKEYWKQYSLNNKEEIREKNKIWYKNNKEKQKIYQLNNKDKIMNYQKNYGKENRKKLNIYQKNRNNKYLNIKISHNLRNRIYKTLKLNRKSAKTKELLGCTEEFFINHLEYQFQEGMGWENYGSKWEIDHIIPCSWYILKDEEEQKKCFKYTNLQPLWQKDNIIKSNKILAYLLIFGEI